MTLYTDYLEELTPQKLMETLNKFFIHIEKEYGAKEPNLYFIERQFRQGDRFGVFVFYQREIK